MATRPSRDADAAERALGLADRRGETASERAAREAWELRLAPLAEALEPVEPPDGLFAAVEQRLSAAAARRRQRAAERRGDRYRGMALFAGAVAAALAAYVWVPGLAPEPAAPPADRFVAVVYSDADPTAPGMIVQVDAASGVATVTPMPLEVPEGRSYEMWRLPEGADRPVSIGLLPRDPVLRPGLEAAPGDTFAISLEPAGGSPTGQPTRPLYHGTVVRVAPSD